MPNIRIKGASKEMIAEYATKINEVASLVDCAPEKVFIIDDGQETIYAIAQVQNPVYITIEWKQRLLKEQVIVDHLVNFFKTYSTNVRIAFRDFDDKWYVNGVKS